jgi:integrase
LASEANTLSTEHMLKTYANQQLSSDHIRPVISLSPCRHPKGSDMATIRQRGKNWQVIVKRKGYPLQSKTFDLKKNAEIWGRKQERLLDTGTWSDTVPAFQNSLNDLLDRYLAEITPSKRGAVAETSRIRSIKRTSIVKYAVGAITGQLLASWRDSRLKEVSGSTVAKELGVLHHAYAVAIKEWGFGLHSNPISLVRKPSQPPARDRVLSAFERAALIAACQNCRNTWILPVVRFALETAARRGEILGLTWSNIDLIAGTAKVDGKTGPRSIPLSPACISMLEGLPRSIDGFVFPVSVEALKQAYERAVTRSGIKDFTFHDLRHDALTKLAKQGFTVLELRAISGHTTATMLQRYVSIDTSELAKKMAAAR